MGGAADKVQAVTGAEVTSIYKKGQEKKIRSQINLKPRIKAPVKRGQKLGEILIYDDQELIKKVDAVAAQDVLRSSLAGPIGFPWGYVVVVLLLLAAIYYFYRRRPG